jgi:predicted TIM-barrel fold metal-dependent hydrolase
MFASNLPVDRLHGTCRAIRERFTQVTAGASAAGQAALFRDNARRIHRL